jgi:hypothetical protein
LTEGTVGDRVREYGRGERLRADDFNKVAAAAGRADNMAGGFGIGLSRTAAGTAITAVGGGSIVLVRMAADSVVRETSRMGDDEGEGQLPASENAVRQAWSDRDAVWVDLSGGFVSVDNPSGVPVQRGEWCVAVRDGSGRLTLAPPSSVALAVTVGDAAQEGFYPPAEDSPSVYCIDFISLPYPQIPGRANVIPAGHDEAMTDDEASEAVRVSPLGPAASPHATVMNLRGGSQYLPEGTVIWCFRTGGRWYTDAAASNTPVQAFARVISGSPYRPAATFSLTVAGSAGGTAGEDFDGVFTLEGGSPTAWGVTSGGVTIAVDLTYAPGAATAAVSTSGGSATYTCASFTTGGSFVFSSGTGGSGQWPGGFSVIPDGEDTQWPCGAVQAVLVRSADDCDWDDHEAILLAPLNPEAPVFRPNTIHPVWPKNTASVPDDEAEVGEGSSVPRRDIALYNGHGGKYVINMINSTVACVDAVMTQVKTFQRQLVIAIADSWME